MERRFILILPTKKIIGQYDLINDKQNGGYRKKHFYMFNLVNAYSERYNTILNKNVITKIIIITDITQIRKIFFLNSTFCLLNGILVIYDS